MDTTCPSDNCSGLVSTRVHFLGHSESKGHRFFFLDLWAERYLGPAGWARGALMSAFKGFT